MILYKLTLRSFSRIMQGVLTHNPLKILQIQKAGPFRQMICTQRNLSNKADGMFSAESLAV